MNDSKNFVNVCIWVILKAVCQALVSKMDISPITSEWSHIFIIATAKLENCFTLFNNKNDLSLSYNFC